MRITRITVYDVSRVWACQDLLTVDVAPGQGARNDGGKLAVDETPGLRHVSAALENLLH